MPEIRLVVTLLLAMVLVVFAAQNTQSVTLRFLTFETPPVPILLAVAVSATVGALLGWIVSAPGAFRRMRQRRSLEHDVQVMERDLEGARGETERVRAEIEETRRAAGPPR